MSNEYTILNFMVEVFKTDVMDGDHAKVLVHCIHKIFVDYQATFDLDDCDKILRVENKTGFVHASFLISFLKDIGCNAQVLQDELPSTHVSPANLFMRN